MGPLVVCNISLSHQCCSHGKTTSCSQQMRPHYPFCNGIVYTKIQTYLKNRQSYLAYKNAFLDFLWEWILLIFCTWTEGKDRLPFVCKTIFRYWVWLEGKGEGKTPKSIPAQSLGTQASLMLSCIRKCWSLNLCLSRLHIQLFYILGGRGGAKICVWIKWAAVIQLRPNAHNG